MDARVTACAGVVSEEEGGSGGHDHGRQRARGGGGRGDLRTGRR